MSDWFHELPVPWMALLVFGFTYLLALAIHAGVAALARSGRAKSFKAVSPDMLPPLGIIFGLFVAFTAAQVWSDNDRASAAVSHEASALRTALVLTASFPGEPEAKLHDLIRTYAHETATVEWPMMAQRFVAQNVSPEAADSEPGMECRTLRRSRLLNPQQRRESGRSGTAALGVALTATGWLRDVAQWSQRRLSVIIG
jgi:hypothetical protein